MVACSFHPGDPVQWRRTGHSDLLHVKRDSRSGKVEPQIRESPERGRPWTRNIKTNPYPERKNCRHWPTVPAIAESLFDATQQLVLAVLSFQSKWSRADRSKPIEMRIMNDQFLQFVQALSCRKERDGFDHSFRFARTADSGRGAKPPDSLSLSPSSRHIVFSQSTRESDPKSGFGLLQDLLRQTTSTEAPDDLQQQIINHLADLVECLNAARFALSDGLEHYVRPEWRCRTASSKSSKFQSPKNQYNHPDWIWSRLQSQNPLQKSADKKRSIKLLQNTLIIQKKHNIYNFINRNLCVYIRMKKKKRRKQDNVTDSSSK